MIIVKYENGDVSYCETMAEAIRETGSRMKSGLPSGYTFEEANI